MPQRRKLTPEIIKTLAKHVSNGHTNIDACRLAGISEATFYRWLKIAEGKTSGLHYDLDEALERANADFKQFHLDIIIDAASTPKKQTHREQISVPGPPGDDGKPTTKIEKVKVTVTETPPQWTASAWLLERKFPDEFASAQRKKRRNRRRPHDQ